MLFSETKVTLKRARNSVFNWLGLQIRSKIFVISEHDILQPGRFKKSKPANQKSFFSKHANHFRYSRWAYCGVHYSDSAVMADPSQSVPTGWETDAVNPSSTSCPAKLCHHLPKGHLGPPWSWGWFLIHLLDVCREYPKKWTHKYDSDS